MSFGLAVTPLSFDRPLGAHQGKVLLRQDPESSHAASQASSAVSTPVLSSFEGELVRKNKPRAVGYAREFLRTAGDNAPSRYVLGMLYAKHGYYSEAAIELARAHRLVPEDYTVSYNLALALFQAKQYQQAEKVLKETIKRQDQAELHSLLADVYEEAGKDIDALNEYRRAVELDPNNDVSWFNLSYELLRHRTFDGAISILEKATQRLPQSYRLQLALGVAYFGQVQVDKAVEAFSKATDLGPESEIGYRMLAEACSMRGSYGKEAVQKFKTFVRLKPMNPWAYYLYAAALQAESATDQRQLDELANLYRESITLNPQFCEAHEKLGEIYLRQRKVSEAVEEFQLAIRLKPGWPDPHYQLARAYVQLGHRAEAEKEFELHRKLQAAEHAKLDKRSEQIRQFILEIK